MLGDVHAVRGDGEIRSLDAESVADVTIQVTRDTKLLLDRPPIEKTNSFVSIATWRDYAEASD